MSTYNIRDRPYSPTVSLLVDMNDYPLLDQPTPLDRAMRRLREQAVLFEIEQERAIQEAKEHNTEIRLIMRKAGRA